jgi:hypothetical protein
MGPLFVGYVVSHVLLLMNCSSRFAKSAQAAVSLCRLAPARQPMIRIIYPAIIRELRN